MCFGPKVTCKPPVCYEILSPATTQAQCALNIQHIKNATKPEFYRSPEAEISFLTWEIKMK